jgi:hypothetical protein
MLAGAGRRRPGCTAIEGKCRIDKLPVPADGHLVLVQPEAADGCWIRLPRRSAIRSYHSVLVVRPVERPAGYLEARAAAFAARTAIGQAAARNLAARGLSAASVGAKLAVRAVAGRARILPLAVLAARLGLRAAALYLALATHPGTYPRPTRLVDAIGGSSPGAGRVACLIGGQPGALRLARRTHAGTTAR